METIERPAEVAARYPKLGECVIATDEGGVDHDALITAVHGPVCINAAYVVADPSYPVSDERYAVGKFDSHLSSLTHMNAQGAAPGGRFFRYPGEERRNV
jgi:hypothetical protein